MCACVHVFQTQRAANHSYCHRPAFRLPVLKISTFSATFIFRDTYFWPAGSSLLREVFSSCAEWGLLLVVVHRLFSSQWLLLLQSTGSRCGGSAVAAHGLTCSAALWDLHGPGSPCAPLHWEADSYQLYHQGSSLHFFLMVVQYSIIWMHQPLK